MYVTEKYLTLIQKLIFLEVLFTITRIYFHLFYMQVSIKFLLLFQLSSLIKSILKSLVILAI